MRKVCRALAIFVLLAYLASCGCSVSLAQIPPQNGGTGASLDATDDTALVGNGTDFVEVSVPDCASNNDCLNYEQSSNSFSCQSISTGAHGDGANCSAGQYPLGVDADGASQSCTVDESADSSCSGTSTYLDGEGNCDAVGGDVSGGLDALSLGTDVVDVDALKDTDTPADEECATYEATGDTIEWQACGGGGSSIVLDLDDDESDESSGITEIATNADAGDIITEPSADKLLIDFNKPWPTCVAVAGDEMTGTLTMDARVEVNPTKKLPRYLSHDRCSGGFCTNAGGVCTDNNDCGDPYNDFTQCDRGLGGEVLCQIGEDAVRWAFKCYDNTDCDGVWIYDKDDTPIFKLDPYSSTPLQIAGGATIDGALTVNDSGAAVDVRIECDTNGNCLFVDGSGDCVAVGTNDCNTYAFRVLGIAEFTGGAQVGGALTQAGGAVQFNALGESYASRFFCDNDSYCLYVDAPDDCVAVGDSDCTEKLDVKGNIGVTGTVDGLDPSIVAGCLAGEYYEGDDTCVAPAGDVAGALDALTIQANAVEESMLKAVNTPTDEYCITYEATAGDFEWQVCASGAHGDGANCSAGQYPLGVDADGAVQSCTVDESADSSCSGTSTYLDGEGNCDAVGGDVSGGLDALSLGTDVVDVDALKDTDTPADEECATYEATGDTIEWQACGGGADSNASTLCNDDEVLLGQDSTTCKTVLDDEQVCFTIEELSADDDNLPLWSPREASTINSAWCLCVGTCTTEADVSLEDGAGNAMTGSVTCEDVTTGDTETSITSGTLTARELLALDVDNTPTSGDTYTICLRYTID